MVSSVLLLKNLMEMTRIWLTGSFLWTYEWRSNILAKPKRFDLEQRFGCHVLFIQGEAIPRWQSQKSSWHVPYQERNVWMHYPQWQLVQQLHVSVWRKYFASGSFWTVFVLDVAFIDNSGGILLATQQKPRRWIFSSHELPDHQLILPISLAPAQLLLTGREKQFFVLCVCL